MLDVFDALAMADDDARLRAFREMYVGDRIDVYELERKTDERLDELLHADELTEQLSQQKLSDAVEADVQRIVTRRANAPFPLKAP